MISDKRKKHIEKLAKNRKGMQFPTEWRKNISISREGFIMKEETKKKISEALKGKSTSTWTIKGSSCYNWKGGSWIWWQKEIKKRDHFTCVYCGLYDPDIVEVCHIKPIKGLVNRVKSGHPLNSYENLTTLCPNCHARFDRGIITLERKNTSGS